MFIPESLKSWRKAQSVRVSLSLLCLSAFLLSLPPASAQTPGFSLTMQAFPPPAAIEPGGNAGANLVLDSVNGFTGNVTLSCQVTIAGTSTVVNDPACQISPSTVTPPGGASVTITSTGATPTGRYIITVTGTAAAPAAPQSASQDISVLAVVPQFTITVFKIVAPSSIPAGHGAVGIVSINPIFGYESPAGGVTLSCGAMTPLSTLPPICSFSPNPVTVNAGEPVTSNLTITTFGPITSGPAERTSALWMPLPMLLLAGLGAAAGGKRARKAWGLLALFVVSGSFLLMPACASNASSTRTPNGITPANSYTFTVVGVDANGNASSNTSSSSSAPTVSLAVTAPTTN
jgi:hypothetical protein